jgi:hypothetical protein
MKESQYESEETLGEDHWLSKMDGHLDWRVIPPPIRDPYSIPLTDLVLDAMSKNTAVIKKHMKVRCLCEGHELLMISNLCAPSVRTDHPCLSHLTRNEVLLCFDQFNLWALVDAAIERVQQEVAEELHRREMNRLANKSFKRTMGQILADADRAKKAEREDLKKMQEKKIQEKKGQAKMGNGPRIIRR